MTSEIDKFIGKTLESVEAVDHLIGSPIEPFVCFAEFSGYDSPYFVTLIDTLEQLLDFLHCAEFSGFVVDEKYNFSTVTEENSDQKRVSILFNHYWNNVTIRFHVYVRPSVVFEYRIREVIGRENM